MAVQVLYADGTRQWVPGDFYHDAGPVVYDERTYVYHYCGGFLVVTLTVERDFSEADGVISQAPDSSVTEWRRWRDQWNAWPIYCEGSRLDPNKVGEDE